MMKKITIFLYMLLNLSTILASSQISKTSQTSETEQHVDIVGRNKQIDLTQDCETYTDCYNCTVSTCYWSTADTCSGPSSNRKDLTIDHLIANGKQCKPKTEEKNLCNFD